MPNCYTCGEDITFNKSILSKTGKQIPLWPDQRSTHSHDEQGKPIRKPLPNQDLDPQQTEQFNQYNRQTQEPVAKPLQPPYSGGQSQGGSYMDTKRLRVMIEEIGKKQLEHDETLQSIYALCRNISNMSLQLMNHFKLVEPTTAAALHQQQQNPDDKYRKEQEEIAKWNFAKDNDDDDNNDDEKLEEKEGI